MIPLNFLSEGFISIYRNHIHITGHTHQTHPPNAIE